MVHRRQRSWAGGLTEILPVMVKKSFKNEVVSVTEIMIVSFTPNHAENRVLSGNMVLKAFHKQTYCTCRQQNCGFPIFSQLFDYLCQIFREASFKFFTKIKKIA